MGKLERVCGDGLSCLEEQCAAMAVAYQDLEQDSDRIVMQTKAGKGSLSAQYDYAFLQYVNEKYVKRFDYKWLLEVGAGDGRLAQVFPGVRYTGIDPVPRSPAVRWGSTLELKSNLYEFVLCNTVLEHVQYDQALIREMYRITQPGGVNFYTVPGIWSYFIYGCHGWRRYSVGEIVGKVSAVGFVVEELKIKGGWGTVLHQFFWIATVGEGKSLLMLSKGKWPKIIYRIQNKLKWGTNYDQLPGYQFTARLALWVDRIFPLNVGVCLVLRKPEKEGA